MKKNTLQSLAAAAQSVSTQAKTEAQVRIATLPAQAFTAPAPTPAPAPQPDPAPRANKVPPKAVRDSSKSRLNLYLTPEYEAFVREIRKEAVNATGESVSDNAVMRIAIRAIDMSKVAEISAIVLAEDGRRKG